MSETAGADKPLHEATQTKVLTTDFKGSFRCGVGLSYPSKKSNAVFSLARTTGSFVAAGDNRVDDGEEGGETVGGRRNALATPLRVNDCVAGISTSVAPSPAVRRGDSNIASARRRIEPCT